MDTREDPSSASEQDTSLRLWTEAEVQAAEKEAIRKRRNAVKEGPNGNRIPRSELSGAGGAGAATRQLDDALAQGVLKPGYIGLAFSGGGIRSATFALGLAQALARAGLLKYFDYLSTVSGGGYTGGSLTWLLRQREKAGADAAPEFDLDAEHFPYGTAPPRDRQDIRNRTGMLRYLRERGNYLIPGRGITVLSGIAVVLRGILLNLIVWFPIATALFVATLPFSNRVLYAAYAVFALFVGVCILYSLATFPSRSIAPKWWDRYKGRRLFETEAKWLLPAAVGLAVLGSMPLVTDAIRSWAAESGILSIIAGVAGALSKFSGGDKKNGGVMGALIAPVAALLFLYGFALLACLAAVVITSSAVPLISWKIFYIALGVAVATAVLVNSNYISVHRFYRDRLMEAFMPDDANIDANRTGAARGADVARLSALENSGGQNDCGSPYHIINTNLVLVDSENRRYRTRGGDSFVLSPLFCGSSATQYLQTSKFMSDGMTLPTAIAISGAAANPDAGVGGRGPTRDRLVSWVLALFNIRLGYWVPNPLRVVGAEDNNGRILRKAFYRLPPSHITTFRYEMCRGGFKRRRKWLQISDGGHFENLGLYELVRRRVRLIVVSDAGADPDFGFGDLRNAVRRVAEDFGARIDFGRAFWANDATPEYLSRLFPVDSLKAGFPENINLAERGHVIGVIDYGPAMDSSIREYGIVILVKTTLVGGLSLETRGYRGDNPTFPDQTTADQFFDEEQFEAYRELGYVIGSNMIEHARLKDLITTIR